MREIIMRLALIQSLVVQLRIFEMKNLGTLNFAATSPMLPKHCEQICIFDVDFICGGFMNKHDTCAKFQLKVIKMYCFIFYSVFVLTFYSCLWLSV